MVFMKQLIRSGEVLKVVFKDREGTLKAEGEVSLTYNPTDKAEEIAIESHPLRPTSYALDQNYPNPFNPSTIIPYRVPDDSKVKIAIYNMLGQEVCRLVDEKKEQGYHEVVWDGRDMNGNLVGSTMYLVRMEAGGFVRNRKILFIQ